MRPLQWVSMASVLTVGLAFAHDAAEHGKKHSAATAKEQKPWGIAGDAKAVQRTIEIRMADTMRYTPERIEVKLGETVRFVHRNEGKTLHEFSARRKNSTRTPRRCASTPAWSTTSRTWRTSRPARRPRRSGISTVPASSPSPA